MGIEQSPNGANLLVSITERRDEGLRIQQEIEKRTEQIRGAIAMFPTDAEYRHQATRDFDDLLSRRNDYEPGPFTLCLQGFYRNVYDYYNYFIGPSDRIYGKREYRRVGDPG